MHIGFPANVNPWLTFSVQTITGATTAMVAWFVARISKRNSEIARQKLRLDLYERRYAIYREARRFRDSLILWTADEAQTKRADSFIELFEEAKFLFPPESGVSSYLEEMHKHAHFILKFSVFLGAYAGMPQEQIRLSNERSEHVGWLVDSIPELAKLMGPYLNFHSV